MVIGFDGSRAFIKGRTGTENYSYQLLKALSKIDTENYYLVYLRSGTEIKNWPKNFRFVEINYKRFWTQIGLSKQTFKDKLDILFVPSHTLPIIRNPKLKTVITVHDLGAEYLPKMHQVKQQLYLKYMTHKQLKGATKIIAVSKATKMDLIKKAKIDSNKIEVIYEGVDREVYKAVKSDVLLNSLKQLDIEKRKYFLFVGTIQPRKNLERLIKAFYQLPTTNYKLIIVGSKGWLSEEIYELPKKLGIEDKVQFLGHVPDEKLAALYSGAIALIFPSLFEGFGLPILEAMSCGCPVITSNTSSMPEVAGEAAVLVNPLKVEEIAKAMEKVAADNKLRDNLIQKGYKQIEKFSWEKAAKETLKVFQEVMSNG